MTREKMLKISWQPFMVILWKPPRIEEPYEMMLISINFDDEVLMLRPFPGDIFIEQDFYTNLKYCELKPKEIKLKKV